MARDAVATSAGTPRLPNPPGRRHDVLAALRASAVPLTIVEIARRLEVHPNTVRFHLETLTASGQVQRVDVSPTRAGRPAMLFRARPGMDRAGPRNYRLLASIFAAGLRAEPDAVAKATDAGRAWGTAVADPPVTTGYLGPDQAVNRLVGLLDDLGFAPEQQDLDGQRQIGLRHCPFLELVDDQSRIVCATHLGLMQGMISTLNTPVTVQRLEPFAEPNLCLVHLGGTRDGSTSSDRPASRTRA